MTPEKIPNPEPVRCGMWLIIPMLLDAAVKEGTLTSEEAIALLGSTPA